MCPLGGATPHNEPFCAQRPVHGEFDYAGECGTASLHVDRAGLPADAQFGLNWISDPVRGYNVATLASTVTAAPWADLSDSSAPAKSVAAAFS